MNIEDKFYKVSIRENGTTHVAQAGEKNKTLCGREWYFLNDLGGDTYCKRCQGLLFKYKSVSNQGDALLKYLDKEIKEAGKFEKSKRIQDMSPTGFLFGLKSFNRGKRIGLIMARDESAKLLKTESGYEVD